MSCWICQECKTLTTVFLGYFSGLCLQQEMLRDEKMSPYHKEQVYLLLAKKWRILPLCLSPTKQPPRDWVAKGNQRKHEAHAAWCAVSKMPFVSDPGVLGPWTQAKSLERVSNVKWNSTTYRRFVWVFFFFWKDQIKFTRRWKDSINVVNTFEKQY